MKPKFQLRFPVRDIAYWAKRFKDEEKAILPIVPAVKRRGFLTKNEFLMGVPMEIAAVSAALSDKFPRVRLRSHKMRAFDPG